MWVKYGGISHAYKEDMKMKNTNEAISMNAKQSVSLEPFNIKDYQLIAELWERIKGEVRYSGSYVELPKTALRALTNERFRDVISVSAMGFPILNCSDEIEFIKRSYEERLLQNDANPDIIPLTNERVGYDNPWDDSKFPTELIGGARVMPETCIWVNCPHCSGKGVQTQYEWTGGYVKCSRCNGSGKLGVRICKLCNGEGRYWSEKVGRAACGESDCKKCGGKGKLRSVLTAFEHKQGRHALFKFVVFPEETVPKELFSDKSDCNGAFKYKRITDLTSAGKIALSPRNLPDCGDASLRLKEELVKHQKKLREEGDSSKERHQSENIHIDYCVRYVRFHFRYFTPKFNEFLHLDMDEEWHSSIIKLAEKGEFPKGYFSCQHGFQDAVIWLDTATGKTIAQFINRDDQLLHPFNSFQAMLLAMGYHAKRGSKVAVESKRIKRANRLCDGDSENVESRTNVADLDFSTPPETTRKRWKFVVLGLLLGFLGVHLAYAKRWTLFLLLWAGLVTGGSFGTSDDAAKPPADAAAQVRQTEQQKSRNSTISNVGFAVWALLWIGGTLFIKKDGKGNRM